MTITIRQGDCLKVMRRMRDNSVDCCVTSPPYWGLRDYGVAGQMGLEKSLGEHLDVMVEVFREVRRILKPTGTLWLNYGDSYACHPNGRKAENITGDDRAFRDKPFSTVGAIHRGRRIERGAGRWGGGNLPAGGVLKPKDLCMIPNRLAIALQEDGWWVRSEIIWGKPNAMPDSTKDRPGSAHEKIFLLSKSAKYFYDAAAVMLPATSSARDYIKTPGRCVAPPGQNPQAVARKQDGHGRRHAGFNKRYEESRDCSSRLRNLRNYEAIPPEVWEMSTKAFKGAHFATFPPELAARAIKAGCPPEGIVFDPFGGAGTTALAAEHLGRDSVLIELSADYITLAQRRLRSALPRSKIIRR